EQARDRALADAQKQTQDVEREKAFQRLVKDGQQNMTDKHFDAAVVNFKEALKLKPGDVTAGKLLQNAEKALADTLKTDEQKAAAKKKQEAYEKSMSEGRLAFQQKKWDAAITAFEAAQKLLPGDKASQNFLNDAKKAKADQLAAD